MKLTTEDKKEISAGLRDAGLLLQKAQQSFSYGADLIEQMPGNPSQKEIDHFYTILRQPDSYLKQLADHVARLGKRINEITNNKR